MAQEIYPSSFVCDCGYRCEFSESTVNEVRVESMRRTQTLIADDDLHEVIFDHGAMISLYCPRENVPKEKHPPTGKPA